MLDCRVSSSPGKDRPELDGQNISEVLIALLKGVIYRDTHPELWSALRGLQATVRDYVAVLGLELLLNEAEGYAWLRSRPALEGTPVLPRLVVKRQLSFPVSLLLALLRKKLAEFDATGGDTRLILSRDHVVELVRVFLHSGTNEARMVDQLDAHLNKICELGFLRRLRGNDNLFEVRRILKAFVDAQWLGEFEQRLAEYRSHMVGGEGDVE
ncbi:MAG: hypothetical protein VR69_02880 [Peptococcaceae bacterium BRH_c4b]|nr:MAG: hypothetical protein VR69_02880 [Peptococcaceae bacterium BRH_c4b]